MRTFPIILFSFLLLPHLGCSTTSNQSEEHNFSFVYNDLEYSILSRSLITGKSINYLLLRVDDEIMLSARDNNLDGTLDTMLVGNHSLEKANLVYNYGISQAVSEGRYEQRYPSRIYTQSTSEGFYAIQSFKQSASTWNNRLVIYSTRMRTKVVILDQGADGLLNQIEEGDGDLAASQPLYKRMLEDGIRAGQVVNLNGALVVELPND